MQAYLDLLGDGSLNVDTLIDRVITVDEAPAGYRALLKDDEAPPLGVLIRYPDDPRELPEAPDATRITIRGHKPPRPELINYALVGASAFGMAMLVPQMKKCRDRYHPARCREPEQSAGRQLRPRQRGRGPGLDPRRRVAAIRRFISW